LRVERHLEVHRTPVADAMQPSGCGYADIPRRTATELSTLPLWRKALQYAQSMQKKARGFLGMVSSLAEMPI
jgi:hypothetical protein